MKSNVSISIVPQICFMARRLDLAPDPFFFCFWRQGWAFMELVARAPWRAGFSREKRDLADLCRHKILKSRLAALSKAGARWYIPTATPGQLPRVAFSGSLRTETAPWRWPDPFRHQVFR
jgi:hypothetical protein